MPKLALICLAYATGLYSMTLYEWPAECHCLPLIIISIIWVAASFLLGHPRASSLCLLILVSGMGVHDGITSEIKVARKKEKIDALCSRQENWILKVEEARLAFAKWKLECKALYIENKCVSNRSIRILLHSWDQAHEFKPGEIIEAPLQPRPIESPRNINQFKKASYYASLDIYHESYLEAGSYRTIGSRTSTIEYMRQQLLELFNNAIEDKNALAIIHAMALGDRSRLNRDLKASFSNTGSIHVLAVSGLHVGIIFLICQFLLKPFNIINGGWNIALIPVLWLYALITGMADSTVRACLMVSIFLMAALLDRRIRSYNVIGLTGLAMLMVEPVNLKQVGFQFSFLAVTGILYFYPLWKMHFKHPLIRYISDLFVISFAAQMLVTPISLSIFGRFPVYFWLASAVAIPLAFVIVGLSFTQMVVQLTTTNFGSGLSQLTALLNEWTTQFLIKIMVWIENLPMALIDPIYVAREQILLIYGGIILLMLYLSYRKNVYLISSFITMLFLAGHIYWGKLNQRKNIYLDVWHTRDSSLVTLMHGGYCHAIGNSNDREKAAYLLSGSRMKKYCARNEINYHNLPDKGSIYTMEGFALCLYPELSIMTDSLKAKKYDLVLIGPDSAPEKIINHLNADVYVLDGSRPVWTHVLDTSKVQRTDFRLFSTYENGTLSIQLN